MSKDFWEYTPGGGCAVTSDLRVAKITDTSAVLRWALPTETVSSFKIRYRAVGSTELTKRNVKGGSNYVVLCGLLPNTTYEWQIRSNCTEDTSAWVCGPNFTTASNIAVVSLTDALQAKTNTVQMLVSPNPSKGNFNIHIQLPSKEALTTLIVYNSLGEKVWQQSLGAVNGSVIKNIDLENKLTTGIYTLRIERNDIRLMQKVVVTK
ncbi:T9SS type A sorting domain-containing protein [Panacibacter ginsenosidivorans]|uniref:T9SS type A sorting domain-containing protein n=1 Tax=Panacibacter ginsenosidivorans TaxID=1813871 RepID=A0A5B8V7W4_9BACT|nr:fibronectin type III domain-containing protein [Panacibacter ginsenosidivorans]QEC66911.1 T9SS type A sorting domain-containing protein [Panacibacter ginsenosidivorans]